MNKTILIAFLFHLPGIKFFTDFELINPPIKMNIVFLLLTLIATASCYYLTLSILFSIFCFLCGHLALSAFLIRWILIKKQGTIS